MNKIEKAKVPRKFSIGINTYKVQLMKKVAKGSVNGRVWLDLFVVQLAKRTKNGVRSPEQIEQTFWHETVHAILADMGHELNRDEDFVEAFARRIYQVTKTSEF